MTLILPLLLLALARPSAAQAPAPLNIVFVDVCSARADHFSLYGYARRTTPRMDALFRDKEAAVFDNALAQSSWCRPNYASLFTGHTPEVHGMYTNVPGPLPWFESPLADRLRKSGYRTAAFSGGVYLLKAFGLSRGFDAYVNIFSTATASRLPGSADETIGPALSWAAGSDGRPFFLYLAVDDLHVPYHADPPDRFGPALASTTTLSVPFFRAYNGEPSGYTPELAARAADFKKNPENLARLVNRYDAALHHVDGQVGELVRRLKAMGLWSRTVLVINADHGEMLGEHGLLGHTEGLYEPVLHVPLLVHAPQLPAAQGRRFEQLVERVDLMPTLLDFAGAAYDPEEFQGRSLLPLLSDPAAPGRKYAYASSKRDLAAMTDFNIDERVARSERWKLHWSLYKDAFELYDLQADPLETRDLAGQRPDVVSGLSFELDRLIELNRPHAPGPVSGAVAPAEARLKKAVAPR